MKRRRKYHRLWWNEELRGWIKQGALAGGEDREVIKYAFLQLALLGTSQTVGTGKMLFKTIGLGSEVFEMYDLLQRNYMHTRGKRKQNST